MSIIYWLCWLLFAVTMMCVNVWSAISMDSAVNTVAQCIFAVLQALCALFFAKKTMDAIRKRQLGT